MHAYDDMLSMSSRTAGQVALLLWADVHVEQAPLKRSRLSEYNAW